MPGALFFGEAGGARIIRANTGRSQVGDPHQILVEPWDLVPAGEAGDSSFRSVDVSLKVSSGYELGVVPIVDGVALPEQFFTGVGAGPVLVQAFIEERGARITGRVRTLSLAGDIELMDIGAEFVVLREAP